jgi:hypothetical protein
MLKMWRFSLLAFVMLLAMLWQGGAAAASSGWTVVPSVNPPGDDTLFAVAATSAKDAWAVGSSNQQSFTPQTLTEHWNGSSWSVIPSPNPGSSSFNKLFGVTALSSSNAWAVGYYQGNSGGVLTLVEHWNGTAWSVVPSPNPSGFIANQLFAVSAFSANNIWAAGTSQTNNNVTQTLTEHWNGTAWSVVPSVNPGASFSTLKGVVAVSSTNAWAVGNYTNQQGASQTLTEQWNGTAWSVVPSANPASDNYLFGVTRVPGSNQLWAVGEYSNGSGGQPLTEYWNGTNWSAVASPTIKANVSSLDGVTAISATNIWAVGQAGTPSGGVGIANSGPAGKTLIMHWNGTRWSIVSSPNPGTFNNSLFGVARVPATSQVWTVGAYNNGTPPVQTLIEFHN